MTILIEQQHYLAKGLPQAVAAEEAFRHIFTFLHTPKESVSS